jgi:hypothetical protein
MGFADPVRAENVHDVKSYMSYVCQTVGSPWTMADEHIMGKKVKGFFSAYPECGFETLVRVAQWARAKKKRPARAFLVVDMARYAWSDGAVPEMDPRNVNLALEANIRNVLETETDPAWRERLVMASGEGRKAVYRQWMAVHH